MNKQTETLGKHKKPQTFQKRLLGRLRLFARQKLIPLLPRKIRSELYRSMIHFETESCHTIELKVAQSREELEAAARLLHDNYVRSGFMVPHRSGMRLTKYHCLPTTTTLIACIDGKVAGTVSLIRKSSFGVPIDAICDLKPFLQKGERVIEVSSLAVAPEFSRQNGRILLPLLNYLFQYSENYFGGDYLVIAVNPTWWDFYEHVLLFERLQERPIKNYSFVNGAPAVMGILDLKQARVRYREVYNHRPEHRNLFYALGELKLKGAKYPSRDFGIVNDPVLTPELLYEFFSVHTDIFPSLTESEKETLWRLYTDPRYRLVLPRPRQNLSSSQVDGRAPAPRLDVELSVAVEVNSPRKAKPISAQLKNITTKGALLVSDRGLRIGERVTIEIPLGQSQFKARFEVVWSNPDGSNGMKVLGFPIEWLRLVKIHETLSSVPADGRLSTEKIWAQTRAELEQDLQIHNASEGRARVS